MQNHWLAFAPFAVLLGTALMVGVVSLIIKVTAYNVKLVPSYPVMPKRRAEILYFPVPMVPREDAPPTLAGGQSSETKAVDIRIRGASERPRRTGGVVNFG